MVIPAIITGVSCAMPQQDRGGVRIVLSSSHQEVGVNISTETHDFEGLCTRNPTKLCTVSAITTPSTSTLLLL